MLLLSSLSLSGLNTLVSLNGSGDGFGVGVDWKLEADETLETGRHFLVKSRRQR